MGRYHAVVRWLPGILSITLLATPATATAADADALAAFLDSSSSTITGVVHEVARLSGATPLPSGQTLISRSVHHPDLWFAEEYVIESLGALPGVEVRTEMVDGTDDLDGMQVTIDGLRNIIADLPGADPDLPIVVVSAHLDSTAKAEPGGWDPTVDPAPGADDDASGVAAVMALAGAFSRWEPGFERTIRFVLFTAEEIGLQGSFAHVDGLPGSTEIDLVVQLDPVGFNGGSDDRLWFTYDGRWPESTDLVEAAAAARGSYLVVQGVNRSLLGAQAERSDHFPFWEGGFRAVHFGAFPPPPDYHKTTDTLEVVDAAFLDEVTSVVLELAAARAAPLPVITEPGAGCGCAQSRSPARGWLGWFGICFALVLAPRARRRR